MALPPNQQRTMPPENGVSVYVGMMLGVLLLAALASESLWFVGLVGAFGMGYLMAQVSRLLQRAQALEDRLERMSMALNQVMRERESVEEPQPRLVQPPAPVAVQPVVQPVVRPVVRPVVPAPDPFDWEGLWRSLAGPIAGMGGDGASDVGAAEARIGTVWLSRIGILLILVSAIVGYTLLESTWLQAAIGWTGGLALIGLGFWGRRKGYGPWSQAVTGGGIGLLYLVTTAAATVFVPPVLPIPAAFGVMILVTVLGTYLAVSHDSIAVGVLAMVGGFATPFLLSSGEGNFRVLFTYMAILDLGLLGVAWFKRWPLYNYLLFAATWFIYSSWRGTAYTPADSGWAFLFASVFFLIFAGVSIQYNILHREKSRYQDLGVVLANGFLYFGSGLDLLPAGFDRAGFAFLMAFAHAGLGYLTLKRNPVDRLMQLSLLWLGGIFLTIAFPVALTGPWIAVAWALEATCLVWAGFLVNEPWVRTGGKAVFVLATGRLLLWETFPQWFGLSLPGPVLRGFTFLVAVTAFYLAVWAYARYRGDRRALTGLAVGANLLTLWYITFEITLAYDAAHNGRIAGHESLAIAAAWGFYGLLAAVAERRFQHESVRMGARAVLLAALAWLVMGALMANARWALPGHRYLAYAGVLGGIWGVEHLFRNREDKLGLQGLLSLTAVLAGLGIAAFEVVRFLEPSFTLPDGAQRTPEWRSWRDSTQTFWIAAVWGAYSLAAMGVGAWLRSSRTCLLSVILSGFTFVYLLSQGLSNLAAAPWLRGLAFAAVVPGAWLSAWLAHRFRDRLRAVERKAAEFGALGAVVLTLAWLRAEVGFLALAGATLEEFLLSAVWGVYGFLVLAAGFVLRHRSTRLLALGIVGLTIAKIGLYDMWQLEFIWRFWIGLAIGSLMVVASLAYQRFLKIIVGE